MDTVIKEVWPQYPILPAARMQNLLTKEVVIPSKAFPCTDDLDRDFPRACFLLALGHNLRTYQGEETFDFELCIWRHYTPLPVDSPIEELSDLAPELLYQISSVCTQRATHDAMLAACVRAQRWVVIIRTVP